MRHRKKRVILSRTKGPRQALLRNLATSVLLYEKVRTTKAKAKFVRPIVEKAISLSKGGDISSRRKLHSMFTLNNVVKKLMEEIGPKYKERKGGYTRITALGRRQGDAAEMVQIELV
jgi:large subunit ribosomal protein L17